MRPIRGQPLTLTALLTAILLTSLASPIIPNAAADHAVELYRSERFDYYFFYDASKWEIAARASEPGSDVVRFADGDAWVTYAAFAAPGLTPEACIESILDRFYEDPTILAYAALTVEGGPAHIDVYDDGVAAGVRLVMTIDGSDGAFKLATSEQCDVLVPGQSLLYTSVNVPAATFNQTQQLDVPWLAGYLPRDELTADTASVPIRDAGGAIRGAFVAMAGCAGFDGSKYGIARGAGGNETFVIDPSAIVAVYDAAATVPAFTAWLYPPLPAESSLGLGPDELGLIKLHVDLKAAEATVADLYYLSPTASPVSLGQVVGCGGGAAAPVIIDME